MVIVVVPIIRRNFIKENIAKLEKNLLTLSHKDINGILKEIYRLAHQEFFEISILNKFLRRIQKKKEYYYQKQYIARDWNALFSTIMLSLLLFIFITLYYYVETQPWISIALFMIALYIIRKIGISLYYWWNPQYHEYKKYYENFSFIEKKLQHKIANVRKRYESKK